MILIFGSTEDPHVTAVQREIELNGCECAVLDIYSEYSWQLNSNHSKNILWSIGIGKEIEKAIGAVWWRLKPKNKIPKTTAEDLYNYYFQSREWGAILDNISISLSCVPWINNREINKSASNKINQLSLAEKLGFKIPKTIVANDHVSILQFMDSIGHEEILCKTLTGYASPAGNVTFSTLLNRNSVQEQARSISVCPAIYQEYLVKEYELRITIVGEELFVARIDGNIHETSKIDWRRNIFSDMYSQWEIADDLKFRLLSYHKMLGLIYATYDLIVDTSGNAIFLEVNPSGQWMWLEECLGLPIAACLAKELIRLHKNSSCAMGGF